jgi:hypothetical protein
MAMKLETIERSVSIIGGAITLLAALWVLIGFFTHGGLISALGGVAKSSLHNVRIISDVRISPSEPCSSSKDPISDCTAVCNATGEKVLGGGCAAVNGGGNLQYTLPSGSDAVKANIVSKLNPSETKWTCGWRSSSYDRIVAYAICGKKTSLEDSIDNAAGSPRNQVTADKKLQ